MLSGNLDRDLLLTLNSLAGSDRLQRVAVQYHLEIEYIDFVSIEEVREALHQFDIGLLPERFDIVIEPNAGSHLPI